MLIHDLLIDNLKKIINNHNNRINIYLIAISLALAL